MTDPPSPQEALRQLAEATSSLSHAAAAGDLEGAGRALTGRQAALDALRLAAESAPLEPGQLEQLARVLQESGDAGRSLVARRETARALLGELETQRLGLQALAPRQPAFPSRVDLEA